jgi:2-polyprenyl-6-methoxyphenol hydroxylase-like FAD-dependent oxidoreductase
VLAGELAHADGVADGLARYEALLRPFLREKQDAAEGFAGAFAPRTRLGLFVRNQVTRAFALPLVAKLVFGASLLDRIQLPRYSDR